MALRIPALFMRGGTSKGVFFLESDLPGDWEKRDAMLLRIVGSPDPFGTQMDGMGCATSSTSKVVIIGPSTRADCDVDYLFGAVSIDKPFIDWSGNCGNLTAAVGPFAVLHGLVKSARTAQRDADSVTVRIWQANLGAKIVARVPLRDGLPLESGDFVLDGVAFPSAGIDLEFIDPADTAGGIFPTGRALDLLDVPGLGSVEASLVNAGNPAIFVEARALGLTALELPADLNADAELLARFESVRAVAAVAMGLAASPEEATSKRPATPKIAIVAPPSDYRSTAGVLIKSESMDLAARIVSMGKVHHAMTGTGSIALAVAAAIPGTTVHRVTRGGRSGALRIGHAAGTIAVGAEVRREGDEWIVSKVGMTRSARILMSGFVHLPD